MGTSHEVRITLRGNNLGGLFPEEVDYMAVWGMMRDCRRHPGIRGELRSLIGGEHFQDFMVLVEMCDELSEAAA